MKHSNLHGTLTEQNLLKAFAGESQAANRYRFFAQKAREEGYAKIAFFFEETVRNEQMHARLFFDVLLGGMVEITAAYPAGRIGNTLENLDAAAKGEYDEWSDLYPEFSKVAESEGYPAIACRFMQIALIEKTHEERFRGLYEMLRGNQIFQKEREVVWRCMECGYIHTSAEAPDGCPVCGFPRGAFEIRSDRY